MKPIGKCLLIVVSILLVIGTALETLCLDGLRGAIFPLIFKDTTVYSSGYSDDKYAKIKKGMTKKEVLSILGNPLKTGQWNKMERLQYTASSKDSHYRIRVIFIANDTVAEKMYYYYVD